MRASLIAAAAYPSGGRKCVSLSLLGCFVVMLCCASHALADDPQTTSAQMANEAFALLNQLRKQNGAPGPLYGSVASFAGDAAALQTSLTHGGLNSNDSGLLALQSDRAAINATLQQHPDAAVAPQWSTIERALDTLTHELGNKAASHNLSPAEPSRTNVSVASAPLPPALPAAPSTSTGATTKESALAVSDPPEIVIASRQRTGESTRIKGYFEGSALKSACIYDRARCLRSFKVNDVVGRQKVQFDLSVGNPSPTTILRLVDADGRIAEAPIAETALAPTIPATSPETAFDTSSANTSENPPAAPSSTNDSATAEIPSHGAMAPPPSKRHTLGANLGNVQINIQHVIQTVNLPPTYRIIGQLVGRGITRAGIYLNGRLVQRIPIISSARVTNFNERIVASDGAPTIRAYTVGNQFTEQPIDVFDAEDAADFADENTELATNPPIQPLQPMMAPGIAVEITVTQPLAGNLYLIGGVISGRNITSAGLYQNGALAQPIGLSTGIAGALSNLMPGSSPSINFNVRFNPYAGPASIRAFNARGAYTEQPITIAGINPYRSPSFVTGNPYGLTRNPYGASGYGANPYRNPLRPSAPLW